MGSICPWNSDSGRPKFYCKMRRGSAPISSHYRRDSDPVPSLRLTKCEKLFMGCCVLVCFLPVIGIALLYYFYSQHSFVLDCVISILVLILIMAILGIVPLVLKKSKQSQVAPAAATKPHIARKPSLCEEVERMLQKQKQKQQRQKE
jgi:hypothetical protein